MDDGISIMYAILLAIAIILLALLVLHRRKVAKQRAEHYRPQPKFRRRNPTRAEVGEQPNPARHFNPNAE